jgi:nucleoside-diphosphate-sugar epimerase
VKIVVTGATGRLGRALVPALRARGHEVVAFGHGDPATIGGVIELDRDDGLAPLSEQLGADVVVAHLAAHRAVDAPATTASERLALVETNVLGTMRLLEACRDHGAARIVLVEAEDPSPMTDLRATELARADVLRVLRDETGIPGVIVRAPRGAGASSGAAIAALVAAVEDPPRGA